MERYKLITLKTIDWFDNHWNLRRAVLSVVAMVPLLIPLGVVGLGAIEAYTVDSATEIVPAESWLDLVTPEGGYDSLTEAVVTIGAVAPLLAIADVAGRIVYAHFLWVPRSTWQLLVHVIMLTPPILTLFNSLWVSTLLIKHFEGREASSELRGETND